MTTNITMRDMIAAGVHFGHQTRYWHPKMNQFIFGIKHKIHIINLEKTLPLYMDALNFLSSVAAKRGKILFVGTKPAAQKILREEAMRCGMPYICHRWLGGLLTNYKTVRQSIKHMKELENIRDSEDFNKMTKKEALVLTRELDKLKLSLEGIKDMAGLPDAIFVVDVGLERNAVTEANKLKIPVVGIVDTNRNPRGIDYLVPANDDSSSAIRFYAQHIADAIIDARSSLPMEAIIAEKEVRRAGKKPMGNKPKGRVVAKRHDEKEEAPVAALPKVEVVEEKTVVVAETKSDSKGKKTAPSRAKKVESTSV